MKFSLALNLGTNGLMVTSELPPMAGQAGCLCHHIQAAPPSTLLDLRVQRLSQDNRIKQRRAWLLLGWVASERSCPCKQPTCPAIGGGSEVTIKPLVSRLSLERPLTSSKDKKRPVSYAGITQASSQFYRPLDETEVEAEAVFRRIFRE
ncbi:hypothetical protein J6590_092267 [Homalodisca vitripennis]|nr:hypothetical protein J6590_092267 [Homalodisca vitripennis]